jgi:hypothetical protein
MAYNAYLQLPVLKKSQSTCDNCIGTVSQISFNHTNFPIFLGEDLPVPSPGTGLTKVYFIFMNQMLISIEGFAEITFPHAAMAYIDVCENATTTYNKMILKVFVSASGSIN